MITGQATRRPAGRRRLGLVGEARATGAADAVDMPRIERAVREILLAIGEDPDRDGLVATPHRVAKMYEEIFSGLGEDPGEHLSVVFEADHDEMVMVKDIPVYSVCEHHLVPWFGRAHVAYIPNEDGRITGLSKLARLVDGFSRRPQVQERLTTQVADRIEAVLAPRGRAGRRRGRASLHVDARRAQAGDRHGHLGGAGPDARQRGGPQRGHELHPRPLTSQTGGHRHRLPMRDARPCQPWRPAASMADLYPDAGDPGDGRAQRDARFFFRRRHGSTRPRRSPTGGR